MWVVARARRSLEEHQIVAVDDFEVPAVGVEEAEFLGGFAGDARNLVFSKCRDTTRKNGAVRARDVDDVTGRKPAARSGDADGQQAPTLPAQHRHGTGVDGDRSGGPLEVGEPALPRLHWQAAGHEKGPGGASAEELVQHVRLVAVGDEDAAARL